MGTAEQKDTLTVLQIIEYLIQYSNGRIRLAKGERDDSTESKQGAGHFLKLDGKRLGRDIAMYDFFGNEVIGWERTLLMIFEEIMIPLRHAAPENYKAASKPLCELGESIYPEHLIEKWRHLFD